MLEINGEIWNYRKIFKEFEVKEEKEEMLVYDIIVKLLFLIMDSLNIIKGHMIISIK